MLYFDNVFINEKHGLTIPAITIMQLYKNPSYLMFEQNYGLENLFINHVKRSLQTLLIVCFWWPLKLQSTSNCEHRRITSFIQCLQKFFYSWQVFTFLTFLFGFNHNILKHIFALFSAVLCDTFHNAPSYRQTDRQTDRRHYDANAVQSDKT